MYVTIAVMIVMRRVDLVRWLSLILCLSISCAHVPREREMPKELPTCNEDMLKETYHVKGNHLNDIIVVCMQNNKNKYAWFQFHLREIK